LLKDVWKENLTAGGIFLAMIYYEC